MVFGRLIMMSIFTGLLIFSGSTLAAKARKPAAKTRQIKEKVPSKKENAKTAYADLKKEVDAFQKNKTARKYRHNYDKLIDKLEAFGKKWPKSPDAQLALMRAAELSEDVAFISKQTSDYKKAEQIYVKAAKISPSGGLTDEALMAAAYIRKDELNDIAGAKKLLNQVISMKRANQKEQAKKLLADLKGKKQQTAKDRDSAISKNVPIVPPVLHEMQRVVDIQAGANASDFVVTLTGPVEVERGEIPASEGLPRRLFLDLTPAKLGSAVAPPVSGDGIVKVRVGQYQDKTVRFVIELEEQAKPIVIVRDNASVIEIKTPSSAVPATTAVAQANALTSEEAPGQHASLDELVEKVIGQKEVLPDVPRIQEPPTKKAAWQLKRIVIDAGHGGSDPGAIGRSGLREKDVTLAIAKRVKHHLHRELPGLQIFLTRDSDETVTLPARTKYANDVDADLFISIHINAHPNPATEGVETYYLNITHDRYSIRLAARENAVNESAISDLEFILADLQMKSNTQDSMRLGQMVQANLLAKVREEWDDVKDLGLKHALFYVLLGAKMPAILVENSFISNRKEEKRLKDSDYHDAIALGIVKGIRRYSDERQAGVF